jgi:hypothetical protein
MFVDFFNEEQRKRDIEGSIYITEKEREREREGIQLDLGLVWIHMGCICIPFSSRRPKRVPGLR